MKLLDQVRAKIRTLHYSYRTEQTYVRWIVAFIRFHELRQPPQPPIARSHVVMRFRHWRHSRRRMSLPPHPRRV